MTTPVLSALDRLNAAIDKALVQFNDLFVQTEIEFSEFDQGRLVFRRRAGKPEVVVYHPSNGDVPMLLKDCGAALRVEAAAQLIALHTEALKEEERVAAESAVVAEGLENWWRNP